MAILNSTMVGLFKHFYGRYAGVEGTLKTEVIDALMLEIPSPVGVSDDLARRLESALNKISQREVTHLVEEKLLDCHTEAEMRRLQGSPLELPIELQQPDRRELDELVFELLGVESPERRIELVDRLYHETILYYREQRVQDIQSTINRGKRSGTRHISPVELAADAWNELDPELQKPLSVWLEQHAVNAKTVNIPDGPVRLPEAAHFWDANTVFFGSKPGVNLVCDSRAEAELVYRAATAGLRGPVAIPAGERECAEVRDFLERRFEEAKNQFHTLAEMRAGTEKLREQVVDTLHRWFVHGKTG